MEKNQFICPRCLLQHPFDGTLNTTEDIAFSMPKAFYESIHAALVQMDPKIKKASADQESLAKLLSKDERFKCLTTKEVREWMTVYQETPTMISGVLVLTTGWLEEKLDMLKIKGYDLSEVSGTLLLNVICQCYFDKTTDGTLIPNLIRDENFKLASNERRCAKCGRLLCPDTGKAPEMRILLQGNSRAGKTSCIVSAVRWLQDMSAVYGGKIRVILRDKDKDLDESHHHNWIHHELENYNAGYKVIKTPTSQKEPGVFSVMVEVNGQKTVLTFLDMPGEFFEDQMQEEESLLKQYTLIYKYSDVVWTCMQHEVLAFKMLNDEQIREMEERTSLSKALLEKVLDKYKKRIDEIKYHMVNNGITQLPRHAVILTKTDAIASDARQLKDSFVFSADGDNGRDAIGEEVVKGCASTLVLEEEDFKRIALSVSEFFERSDSVKNDGICYHMRDFSDRICYFAMSAYGHPVVEKKSGGDSREMPAAPRPYHVHLPLLWSMTLCDRLPVRYKVTYREPVTGLARLFSQTQYKFTGEGTRTCLFSEADDACRSNLLDNKSAYEYHYALESERR